MGIRFRKFISEQLGLKSSPPGKATFSKTNIEEPIPRMNNFAASWYQSANTEAFHGIPLQPQVASVVVLNRAIQESRLVNGSSVLKIRLPILISHDVSPLQQPSQPTSQPEMSKDHYGANSVRLKVATS